MSSVSVLPLPEMRGEKNSHPAFTEWDEKLGNTNTQDNSFEVWIKKGMKSWGQRQRKESYYFIILSHSSSALLCAYCQQSQIRQQKCDKASHS